MSSNQLEFQQMPMRLEQRIDTTSTVSFSNETIVTGKDHELIRINGSSSYKKSNHAILFRHHPVVSKHQYQLYNLKIPHRSQSSAISPKESATGIIILGFINLIVESWAIFMFLMPFPFFIALFIGELILAFGIAVFLITLYKKNFETAPEWLTHLMKLLRIIGTAMILIAFIWLFLFGFPLFVHFLAAIILLAVIQIGVMLWIYSYLFDPKINKQDLAQSKRTTVRKAAAKAFGVISCVLIFPCFLLLSSFGLLFAAEGIGILSLTLAIILTTILMAILIGSIGILLEIIRIHFLSKLRSLFLKK